MRRVGGAIVGGILGAVMGAAATQLLFALCIMGGPDAESCGMGVYLLVAPALVGAGAILGGFAGLAVDSRERLSQLGSTLGGAVFGVIASVVILLVIASASAAPTPPTSEGVVIEEPAELSVAALDSLHRAVRRSELVFAAGASLPAIASIVGAFLGLRAGRRKSDPATPDEPTDGAAG